MTDDSWRTVPAPLHIRTRSNASDDDGYAERLRAARAEGRLWPGGPTLDEVAERTGIRYE